MTQTAMEKRKIGETRYLQEFRAADGENGEMYLEGYAIVFDSSATHKMTNYTFTETIQRGALDNCDMSDVPLRYNHRDSFLVLARTRNRSLELMVDDRGLKIRAKLIDTSTNRDIYQSVKEGLIDKMSFAFTVAPEGDSWTYGDNSANRTVTNINKLYDVSLVDVPFYDSTSIYARTLELLESNRPEDTGLESLEIRKRRSLAILKLTGGYENE